MKQITKYLGPYGEIQVNYTHQTVVILTMGIWDPVELCVNDEKIAH